MGKNISWSWKNLCYNCKSDTWTLQAVFWRWPCEGKQREAKAFLGKKDGYVKWEAPSKSGHPTKFLPLIRNELKYMWTKRTSVLCYLCLNIVLLLNSLTFKIMKWVTDRKISICYNVWPAKICHLCKSSHWLFLRWYLWSIDIGPWCDSCVHICFQDSFQSYVQFHDPT